MARRDVEVATIGEMRTEDERRIKRNRKTEKMGKGEETTFTISDCVTRTSSTCFHNYDLPRDPYRKPAASRCIIAARHATRVRGIDEGNE